MQRPGLLEAESSDAVPRADRPATAQAPEKWATDSDRLTRSAYF